MLGQIHFVLRTMCLQTYHPHSALTCMFPLRATLSSGHKVANSRAHRHTPERVRCAGRGMVVLPMHPGSALRNGKLQILELAPCFLITAGRQGVREGNDADSMTFKWHRSVPFMPVEEGELVASVLGAPALDLEFAPIKVAPDQNGACTQVSCVLVPIRNRVVVHL